MQEKKPCVLEIRALGSCLESIADASAMVPPPHIRIHIPFHGPPICVLKRHLCVSQLDHQSPARSSVSSSYLLTHTLSPTHTHTRIRITQLHDSHLLPFIVTTILAADNGPEAVCTKVELCRVLSAAASSDGGAQLLSNALLLDLCSLSTRDSTHPRFRCSLCKVIEESLRENAALQNHFALTALDAFVQVTAPLTTRARFTPQRSTPAAIALGFKWVLLQHCPLQSMRTTHLAHHAAWDVRCRQPCDTPNVLRHSHPGVVPRLGPLCVCVWTRAQVAISPPGGSHRGGTSIEVWTATVKTITAAMSHPRNMFIQQRCNELLHVAVKLLPRFADSEEIVGVLVALLVAAVDNNVAGATLLSKAKAAKSVVDHILCSPPVEAFAGTILEDSVAVIQMSCMDPSEAVAIVNAVTARLQTTCSPCLATCLIGTLGAMVTEFAEARARLRQLDGLQIMLTVDHGDVVADPTVATRQQSILAILAVVYENKVDRLLMVTPAARVNTAADGREQRIPPPHLLSRRPSRRVGVLADSTNTPVRATASSPKQVAVGVPCRRQRSRTGRAQGDRTSPHPLAAAVTRAYSPSQVATTPTPSPPPLRHIATPPLPSSLGDSDPDMIIAAGTLEQDQDPPSSESPTPAPHERVYEVTLVSDVIPLHSGLSTMELDEFDRELLAMAVSADDDTIPVPHPIAADCAGPATSRGDGSSSDSSAEEVSVALAHRKRRKLDLATRFEGSDMSGRPDQVQPSDDGEAAAEMAAAFLQDEVPDDTSHVEDLERADEENQPASDNGRRRRKEVGSVRDVALVCVVVAPVFETGMSTEEMILTIDLQLPCTLLATTVVGGRNRSSPKGRATIRSPLARHQAHVCCSVGPHAK